MKVTRTILEDGSTSEAFSLTAEETRGLHEAKQIIRDRMDAEKITYNTSDMERISAWLFGLLRWSGVDEMLRQAKTAPFHTGKKTVYVGYASTVEQETH